jgi:DNA-binding transcriptional LysR family regulator
MGGSTSRSPALDLRSLELFCAVYDDRSFSKAARRLRLSQPTLSAHVKALEEELGTRLFDRLGRSIETTRAGDLLYRHGRRILAERDSLLAGMNRFLNRVEGRLHLGASTIPGEYILPRVIASFRALFPLVRVELQIADTTATVDAVEAGRIDLGFVGARLSRKDLRYEPFATDRIVLVAPATARWGSVRGLTLAALRREPLVVREEGSGSRFAVEAGLRKLGVRWEELNVVAELGSTAALKEAVRAELAIAFLSNRAVSSEVDAGWVRQLALPGSSGFERAFYTVRNTRRSRPPIEEEFLRHLKAYPAASDPGQPGPAAKRKDLSGTRS